MLKRVCCLLSLIVGVPFAVNGLPKSATVCYGGKSSGEFSSITKTLPINTINRDGISYECTLEEANALVKKLRAKDVHVFIANGVENHYYYTELIATKEVVFNKRVNLHIALSNNKTTVGSPIIYYGY